MHKRTTRTTSTEKLSPEMERELWAKFDVLSTHMDRTVKAMDDLFVTAFRK